MDTVFKEIFKPVVRTKDNFIMLSRINFDKEVLDIAIYYEGKEVYNANLASDKKLVNKIYKLDASIKGDYEVVVKVKGKSYITNIKMV